MISELPGQDYDILGILTGIRALDEADWKLKLATVFLPIPVHDQLTPSDYRKSLEFFICCG